VPKEMHHPLSHPLATHSHPPPPIATQNHSATHQKEGGRGVLKGLIDGSSDMAAKIY